jgi:cysteine protease ATG4
MGLESLSEPDELDIDMDIDEEDETGEEDEPDGDGEGEQFFDTRSQHTSSGRGQDHDHRRNASKSDELDTEQDPVDPVKCLLGLSTFPKHRVAADLSHFRHTPIRRQCPQQ